MSGGELAVRRAGPDDAEAIVAVIAAVAEEGRWIASEPPIDVPARVARARDAIASGDDVFLLLEAGGRTVGTLGLHRTSAAGVLAVGMAILAGHRGQGGGTLLLRTALAHAIASPAHKLELEVWPDNERAIALYRRHGFAVEGLRRDHWRRRDGTLRSSLLMARPVVAS